MTMCPVMPSELSHAVGTPENSFSRLNTQPIPAPVNACHNPLRGNSHDSGASVVRYSFTARDLHPRLPAGLSRRFGTQDFSPCIVEGFWIRPAFSKAFERKRGGARRGQKGRRVSSKRSSPPLQQKAAEMAGLAADQQSPGLTVTWAAPIIAKRLPAAGGRWGWVKRKG